MLGECLYCVISLASSHIESLSIPVSCTNIASGVCWDAAAVNDYSENHEAYASGDLNNTEDELDLFQLTQSLE